MPKGVPDIHTVGGRIQEARESRGIDTAAELARLLTEAGYRIGRNSIANYEAGRQAPREGALEAMASLFGIPVAKLKYGPQDGESFWLIQLKALEPDLEEHQRTRVLWLANDMAEETRRQRIAAGDLSSEEQRLVAAYRRASAEARRTLLGDAELVGGSEAAPETPAPAAAPRPHRRRTS